MILQKATFAAGCFWNIEHTFSQVPGVIATRAGYCGGTTADPTYEQVCTGQTGHAESVQVAFNPNLVSYDHLLEIFWSIHDPTTVNQQGPDIGSQYRSVTFYHNEDQRALAERSRGHAQKSGRYTNPIVTQIEPIGVFYPAESHHQQFLAKRGASACHTTRP